MVVHETTTSPVCGDYTLNLSSRGPWAQARPTIGGTPSVGSVLSGSNANWVATPSVARSWRRCDTAGANCSDIPGATGATYTVTDADLGRTIRFRNDATDVDATNTSDSAFVEPFIPFEAHGRSHSAQATEFTTGLHSQQHRKPLRCAHLGADGHTADEQLPVRRVSCRKPSERARVPGRPHGPGRGMRERCHTDDLQPGLRGRVGARHELRGQLGYRPLHHAGSRLLDPAGGGVPRAHRQSWKFGRFLRQLRRHAGRGCSVRQRPPRPERRPRRGRHAHGERRRLVRHPGARHLLAPLRCRWRGL